jgi:hypothetical protein
MLMEVADSKCADNNEITTIISLVKNAQDAETDTALVLIQIRKKRTMGILLHTSYSQQLMNCYQSSNYCLQLIPCSRTSLPSRYMGINAAITLQQWAVLCSDDPSLGQSQ